MKQTKLDYSAPQAETFVVRFEGMVCTSGEIGANGIQKSRGLNGSSFGFEDWDDEE